MLPYHHAAREENGCVPIVKQACFLVNAVIPIGEIEDIFGQIRLDIFPALSTVYQGVILYFYAQGLYLCGQKRVSKIGIGDLFHYPVIASCHWYKWLYLLLGIVITSDKEKNCYWQKVCPFHLDLTSCL